ncbi:hypothetical protein [Streptomyces synnematoformans]|uniref:Uncharacterized protein n=1 Tax=Streptomyces synnematoformans TaxID=415721 RepID=A0ABN2XWS9_9ACTN
MTAPLRTDDAGRILTREQRRALEAQEREQAAIDADPAVAQARQDNDQAQAALAELEQRIISGDTKVTATQTGKAREDARHAELRLEAARKKVADERETRRQQERADSEQRAHRALTDTYGDGTLTELRDAAVTALATYLTAVSGYNAALDTARRDLQRHDFPSEAMNGIFRHAGDVNDVAGRGHDGETILVGNDALWLGGHWHARKNPRRLYDQLIAHADRQAGGQVAQLVEAENIAENIRR